MAVAYTTQNRALTVSLSGELDHHRVKGVIRELEGEIDRLLPQQLVVDCAGVRDLPEQPGRVFRAAGLARLIPTEPIPERSDA